LDVSVNNQVARRLFEENAKSTTKTDLVLDTACDGILAILRKHPDLKYKLRIFLNQEIPQPIRFTAWQLFFSNLAGKLQIYFYCVEFYFPKIKNIFNYNRKKNIC
jgi:hypothetical protein